MTAPVWPAGATCGRCKWWAKVGPDLGCCEWHTPIDGLPGQNEAHTDRDHGCRAWEPKE